ncbi:hypothetical protein PV08_00625 [Exophiala spinifera]|uniref:Zn(2)-C6 fungal-type domain-containing protein n=1 Tax=Exophiala spinifera TaxID=91928 RepID=A0A0D2BNE6_9EURO|nr:uncharacterized protein PV08_00625 [Exophiala spinifera]KIW20050.1 hypothetical protein PV08_00625 [Exophiala spinifera]
MTEAKDYVNQHRQSSPSPPSHPTRMSDQKASWSTGTIDMDGVAGGSTAPEGAHSRKRSADHLPSEPHISRKGRACLACRKLKVKCDSLERGDAGCSRCQRLGVDCITSKRMRYSLEDEDGRLHPHVVRLDRAVEDILSHLKMPSLDSYAQFQSSAVSESHHQQPSIQLLPPHHHHHHQQQQQQQQQHQEERHSLLLAPTEPPSHSQTTRENSREPPGTVDPENASSEMAPAPMGSLYEVTQLTSLRSRLLKHGAPAGRRNSRKKMDHHDMVSLGVLSVDEAEAMFALFKTTLSRYLFDAPIDESRSLQSVRESSTLFFTAIVTVTSLHIPGREHVYALAHGHLRELIATSFFDRFHTLEDVRALCIAAFWLPDLSWKLSGHCVRMATELNLHQAFYKAFYSVRQQSKPPQPPPPPSLLAPQPQEHDSGGGSNSNSNNGSTRGDVEPDRPAQLERARLWYLLYVLDHHFSIAYGRPPVTAELQAIKEYDVFLSAPECTPSDRRVLSQVTLFIILSQAYGHFGLEAERLMDGDDVSLRTHARFIEDLDRWRYQFRHALNRDAHIGDYPAVGVDLHYYFASMMLNSLALRGRSLSTISSTSTLPTSLRPLASQAINSAHQILIVVLDEPSIRDSMVGVPLYLHTVIAFAVVFLIKMSSRWAGIGVTIDPDQKTKPLIEAVIDLFRSCRAGKNHILYAMADGFERLLKSNMGAQAVTGKAENGHAHGQALMTARANGQHATGYTHPTHSMPQQAQSEVYGPGTSAILAPQHNTLSPTAYTPQSQSHPNAGGVYDAYLSPHSQPTSTGTYGGWQTEDDMLWSMGMGYDLLATAPDVNAQGFPGWPGSGSGDMTGVGYGV